MDDEARRAKAGQLVEARNTRDLDWLDTLDHDDVVIHQWRDGLVASETSYYAAPSRRQPGGPNGSSQ